MKKKIYISLPISGKDFKEQREYADKVAHSLSRQGWDVVNPFNIYAGRNPNYYDHLAFGLRALMDCDAVFFCREWVKSFGCNVEHDYVMRSIAMGRKTYKVIYEGQELYD